MDTAIHAYFLSLYSEIGEGVTVNILRLSDGLIQPWPRQEICCIGMLQTQRHMTRLHALSGKKKA
jgi:hypothetical protein